MPYFHPLSDDEKYVISAHIPRELVPEGLRFNGKEDTQKFNIYIKKGQLVHLEHFSTEKNPPACSDWKSYNIPSYLLLAPAFVDCHVHLALDGINGFNNFQKPQPPGLLLERLARTAEAGVMAVRDGSDRFNSALALFNSMASMKRSITSEKPLPELVTTGTAIFRQGCYGSFLSSKGINSIKEVYNKVQQLANMGVDQVKVVLSGLVSFQEKGTVNGPVQFSLQEMKEIVQAASRYGLPVMAHASSDKAARLAAEAGVHSIEHGYFISRETLKLMAGKGVAWVPTVAPLYAVFKKARNTSLPAVNIEAVSYAVKQQLEMINLAHNKGVLLGLGTDTGSPGVGWDKGYSMEMSLFARAGIPPVELLKIASQNGSKVLGLSRKMGTVKKGQAPYLVCLERGFLTIPDKHSKPEAIFFPAKSRK